MRLVEKCALTGFFFHTTTLWSKKWCWCTCHLTSQTWCRMSSSQHLLQTRRDLSQWQRLDDKDLSQWQRLDDKDLSQWQRLDDKDLSQWQRLNNNVMSPVLDLRQDPPPLDLSFWSFLTFLHYGIEKVERHLMLKFHKKIQRKSWSNVPSKLLACIRFLYKVVHKNGRLRKFNRSREIEFNFFTAWTIFMKLGTLVHHVPGYKTLPQIF